MWTSCLTQSLNMWRTFIQQKCILYHQIYITTKIENNVDLVSKPFTIIHVDINSLSREAIVSNFNNLITVVRAKYSTHLVFSSILRRPVDYDITRSKV